MSVYHDSQIILRDGRILGYAEAGDPQGKPVIHMHGWPSSRLEVKLLDAALRDQGIRLIGVDRPGAGKSTLTSGWRILDWPDDLTELADQLGLERFAILGWSGGGPYVAACAYKIPTRLTACGMIACMGPYQLVNPEGMMPGLRLLYNTAWRLPWLFSPLLFLAWGRYSRDVEALAGKLTDWKNSLPPPDREIYDQASWRQIVVEFMVESFRQGISQLAYDPRLVVQPWGFKVEDICFERVYIWHGEQDVNVPPQYGRYYAKNIPNCKFTLYPNEAHISIIIKHVNEITKILVN